MFNKHLLNIPHPALLCTVHFRNKSRQQFALLAQCEITGICLPFSKNLDFVKRFFVISGMFILYLSEISISSYLIHFGGKYYFSNVRRYQPL